MSKGSPIVPVRIPAELLGQIEAALDSHNKHSFHHYNRTQWILAAVREKLSHLARSKRPKKSAKPAELPVAG